MYKESIPILRVEGKCLVGGMTRPRWSAQRRLEFIEFRLYWEGRVNRSDLTDFFGISVPQASADLTTYQQMAEGNMVYDKTAKAYVAGPRFVPVFFVPSADRYLAELQLLDTGLLSSEESRVGRLPAHSVLPILRRRVDPWTLRCVLDAIRTSSSVEVRYQSFSRPEPTWRRLTPHALGFDGLRWHVRAWCHTRARFLDFVMGRILEVRDPQPDAVDPSSDVGWNFKVVLKIGPHPKLTGGTRSVTELDYGMENGVLEVTTRACMVPYLERLIGLDQNPEEVDPKEQQIVLLNRDEVARALLASGVTGVGQ